MRRGLGLALVACLVAVGCGGDDDDRSAATDGDATTTAAQPAAAGAGSEDGASDGDGTAVTVEGFAFQPATIEVPVGTTVTWSNQDSAPHTVTAGTPEATSDAFHQALDPGATAEITFDQAGTFAYHCSVHPSMRGEVVVS